MIHERLQNRGLSRPESDLRIRSQFAPLKKAELADYVLWGGASMNFYLNKWTNSIQRLLKLILFQNKKYASKENHPYKKN